MTDWPLAELLPHAGDMILIDQVLSFDEEQIQTRLTVKPGDTARAGIPSQPQ